MRGLRTGIKAPARAGQTPAGQTHRSAPMEGTALEGIESRYPLLFSEVEWPWGPTRARFELFEMPPDERLITNVNILPLLAGQWGVLQMWNGTWDILGGTLEPGETYLETLRRELVEEAGARLLSFRLIGGWHCHSLSAGPYRPHLPHPEYYRLVGVGEIEVGGKPSNPAGAEQVLEVRFALLEEVVSRLVSVGRHDLAELYRLAAELT